MTTQALKQGAAMVSRRDAMVAAFLALFLGSVLTFGTGMAAPDAVHNAAHDWRHSMGFPCH
jgi:cobalt transporter subunit CbtB